MSSSVSIKNVTKMFGEVKAVNNANIEIKKGEFFTLLGSSGCGKTTLLRTIAGFYNQEEGSIFFGEQKIDDVPAHKRNIGMVFQNYAIFPHMTVAENVAYGLKARNVSKNEIEKRVSAALDMVQLGHLKDRQPSDMSGGQQQRVALARAIVIEPGILLMDEPLSNLDAKLRLKMRNDIKKLQSRLGITTIYVTHDQQEALAVSDRIAVMDKGIIQQIGTPQEIYMYPANKFVANFIGTTNFITGEITKRDGKSYITISEKEIPLDLNSGYTGKVSYSIRPEGVFLVDDKADDVVEGKIINATFLGDFTSYEVELTSKQVIEVNEYSAQNVRVKSVGETVGVKLSPSKAVIFNESGEEVIS
ncbi:ABC transporter ATP-binding protein [Clostridium swellfunianum]|uniref:ABC transporter ATP-binding protein n=1 Tax=Clostridium swellfunianum TaxID=1367462 RepID=UPI00202DE6D6|nr:ABC transporter ATP-binding protein [Clostridium swellfunianum]MCM0647058.1 ABC transporter ATP-binding protein [Clostridium swellfunianum]